MGNTRGPICCGRAAPCSTAAEVKLVVARDAKEVAAYAANEFPKDAKNLGSATTPSKLVLLKTASQHPFTPIT